jgi:biopolymer transport protein ExbB/TolQ
MFDFLNQGKVLNEPLIEFLLQEKSAELWKSLDHLRMVVRIGPGLGLIGTLIPMGTGLAALSQGDITKLSSDLVIAFTTTVVGLAAGLTAYCFYWKKKRWIEHDIRQMELLAEAMTDRIAKQEFSHEVHVKTQAFSGR